MSGSEYPAPIAILPIYNNQEFNYASSLYYPKFNGIDTLVSTASTATLTNKTISAYQSGSPSSTNFYFKDPGTYVSPYYAVLTKSYSNVSTSPANIFNIFNGTTYLNQMFQLVVCGGNQNYGGWSICWMFSVSGTTPTLGTITQIYSSGAPNLALSGPAASGVIKLKLTGANGSNGSFTVCLTCFPASSIDGPQSYTVQQI